MKLEFEFDSPNIKAYVYFMPETLAAGATFQVFAILRQMEPEVIIFDKTFQSYL